MREDQIVVLTLNIRCDGGIQGLQLPLYALRIFAHRFFQRLDKPSVLGFGPDSDSQMIGQAIAFNWAHNNSLT
ncbi:MAG: hypothetical protein GY797_37755 [Deltaproteobacteria bacterium]|nr:hypothetical protein [Deltaproteobacteria bacterium]